MLVQREFCYMFSSSESIKRSSWGSSFTMRQLRQSTQNRYCVYSWWTSGNETYKKNYDVSTILVSTQLVYPLPWLFWWKIENLNFKLHRVSNTEWAHINSVTALFLFSLAEEREYFLFFFPMFTVGNLTKWQHKATFFHTCECVALILISEILIKTMVSSFPLPPPFLCTVIIFLINQTSSLKVGSAWFWEGAILSYTSQAENPI